MIQPKQNLTTHDKQSLFGNIIDSVMRLNPDGEITDSVWKKFKLIY